jgi:hypothetical protein
MITAKKVYDFNTEKVKSQLVTAFKRRKNESTIADLIATTGLPKYQVQEVNKIILDEYRGQLKATESGELLYYFPSGMHSRIRGFVPTAKRVFKGILRAIGKVLAFLFKIWIMVMLVGYFVLFLLILIGAIVLSIAASGRSNQRSRSSRGGGGAFFLVLQLLQFFLRIFFWVNIVKSMDPNYKQKPKGRPFYKSIFAYVFGEGDTDAEWDSSEKIAVISYIRANKGVITTEELMVLTGKNYDAAQQVVNHYLLEFEGEPMVSDAGTVYFFFPELLRSRAKELLSAQAANPADARYRELIPFTTNKGATNAIITFFNIFNLGFGSYFFFFSLIGPAAAATIDFGGLYTGLLDFLRGNEVILQPYLPVLVILGIIPLSFSVLFFLIPLLRTVPRVRQNRSIKEDNLRKRIYSYVFDNPLMINPGQITPRGELDSPKNPQRFIQKQIDELAAVKQAEIEENENNVLFYNFKEIKREQDDIAAVRNAVDLKKYEVGETVFDSGE